MRHWLKPLSVAVFLLSAANAKADCVVLLHGLARSETSFVLMEQVLQSRGYHVVRPGYPSTEFSIADLAEATIPAALQDCAGETVHFVTHSMGGILLRHWLQDAQRRPPKLGNTVMLGPPNQGSELVDELGDWKVFDYINGPAGASLGTDLDSVPNALPAVDFPVGVIAGNQSISPLFSSLIPGEDDGKVSVESTRVAGMQDHLVLPVTHTFMMNDPVVIVQVLHFLKQQRFAARMRWLDALYTVIDGTNTDAGQQGGESDG